MGEERDRLASIRERLEVADDDGRPIYLHAEDCPSFCDYACNGNQHNGPESPVLDDLAWLLARLDTLRGAPGAGEGAAVAGSREAMDALSRGRNARGDEADEYGDLVAAWQLLIEHTYSRGMTNTFVTMIQTLVTSHKAWFDSYEKASANAKRAWARVRELEDAAAPASAVSAAPGAAPEGAVERHDDH